MANFAKAQPLLPLALLLLLSSPRAGEAAPNTAARSVLCNGAAYGAGDPFAASLAYVLGELLAGTPAGDGRDMYAISPYPSAFAYGRAACRGGGGGVTAADCASCLGAAVARMNATCGRAIGARALLVDCSVRYEQYAFVDF
ncbi:antifungal protein ginkbilobin-like protein [Oryza brachyantha]|uniref:antifungal protein ginkbilobin-like protein n=1 Tax=Oryza brachyantha TaxID=4533 RepID=UPI001ADB96E8|nr:antifungal protein ginkbilobin-like protein [Oryza brachyantha]